MFNSKLIRTRILIPMLAIVAFVSFVGYRVAIGQETLDSFHFSQQAALGRKLAPVPLNLQGKNPDLVYLGSYIVNAQGGCNQCHTCPSFPQGADPYVNGPPQGNDPVPVNTANYRAGGTPFQNSTIISSNLTPDSSGQPGGLTFGEFQKVMNNGQASHKAGHILQVMPWPVFRNMSNNDLVAIYQYLSALPQHSPGTCTGPGQAVR
jgi:hypothetical protein